MQFAVLGDIHTAYDPALDGPVLADPAIDAVLVVGDLAGLRFGPCLQVAADLAALSTQQTVLVQPGNHDTPFPAQLLAEVLGTPWLGRPFVGRQDRRYRAYTQALGAARPMAYRAEPVGDVTVIGCRPFSMGGPRIAFPGMLERRFGVASMQDSRDLLCSLVDESEGPLLFLAHNGPTGLGDAADSIWGRDFHPAEGDWGDADLEAAVVHARQRGRRVVAVVAGHMHLRVRGGRRRTWHVEREGVHYVNAAEVSRVHQGRRHHVLLTVTDDSVQVDARWVG